MAKMIYSDSLCEMVYKGFTRIRKYENGKVGKTHYSWNDSDCVYYSDIVDCDYYDEIPTEGRYENYKGVYDLVIEMDN